MPDNDFSYILTPAEQAEIYHHAVMDMVMPYFEEKFLLHRGHSLKAEMFVSFLISTSPEGSSTIVFDGSNITFPSWRFSRRGNMVAMETDPESVYRAVDAILADSESHYMNLVSVRLDAMGALDRKNAKIFPYLIGKDIIRPLTKDEIEEVVSGIPSLAECFVEAKPWFYEPSASYLRIES